MIPLEQQVTNLDLSQRLAAAGVPQESVWCWYACEVTLHSEVGLFNNIQDEFFICAAYTPAELGEWLPEFINQHDYRLHQWRWYEEHIIHHCIAYRFYHPEAVYQIPNRNIQVDTLADAMGEMLLYLIEKGYVKVKELK